MGEVGVGALLITASPATAGTTIALGAGIAFHGLYGMASSGIGIMNALKETNCPGGGEYVGGALFGDTGRKLGQGLDFFSSLSGLAKGIAGISRSKLAKDVVSDIAEVFNGINDFKDQAGN